MNEIQKAILEMVGLLRKMSISELNEFRDEWPKKSEGQNYSPGSGKLCMDVINAVIREKEGQTHEHKA